MTQVAIDSDLKRVDRLRRNAMLVGKDSHLHALDLSTDQPARTIYDISGEVTYGSGLAVMPAGEILLSNGSALLACDVHGQCREVLRLEEVHLPDLPNPALERHINGPIRFCSEAQRVYFCLCPGRAGEIPPEGRHWTYLCEFDLNTRGVSSVRVRYVGDGCSIDGVSRVAYLPFVARTRQDMLKGRDRLLKKSLAGAPDETLVVPDAVERCELTEDREQILCSHGRCHCLISLVDCRRRSFLGFKRRHCSRLPFKGYNATFGPRNAIFFARTGFSLWRYEAGAKKPERLMEVRAEPGSGQATLVRRMQLRDGVEAVWEEAGPPLIHSQMELLCWRVSLGMSLEVVVVIDLLHDEYMLVNSDWRQMALVEA